MTRFSVHVCVKCGDSWQRPVARGQQPKWCPDCRATSVAEKACAECGVVQPIHTWSKNCKSCWESIQADRAGSRGLQLKCSHCGDGFTGSRTRRYCSPACAGFAQRGALSAALACGDHGGVVDAIRAKSTINEDGCWRWSGKLSKDGYPTVRVAGSSRMVHRLSLEAKLGRPLGSQQSHHVCANASCVNPDHLQPATYAENIAEMKARQSYVDRIRELEAALADVAPGHPLLDVADYALVG